MSTFCLCLIAHELAGMDEKFFVERRAEAGSAGEASGMDAVEEVCSAYAIGSIRRPDGWHIVFVYRRSVPEVDA